MLLEQTSKDFDKMAGEAVDSFLTKGVPLTDAVANIAKDNKLNPNEIERLVEKANTIATLKLLQASKDRNIEFDVAEYEDVLDKVYGTSNDVSEEAIADSVEKEASVKVPNFVESFFKKKREVKLAVPESFYTKTVSSEEPPHVTLFKLKKQYEDLNTEKIATELKIHDTFDFFMSEFNKLYGPDFNKFASEVYTLYGTSAKPLLEPIADRIKTKLELSKVASIIDDTTTLHTKFAELYNSFTKLIDVTDKYNNVKDRLSSFYKEHKIK